MSSTPPSFLSLGEIESRDGAYYGRSTCNLQWRNFLGSLAIELHLGSEGREVRNFLRAVGRRMAGSMPLPQVETLGELETEMNKVWMEIDWGWVRLGARDDKIWIVHGAYPNALSEGEDEIWPRGASAVLEGVYTVWFGAQGSPGVRTTRISERIRPLEFQHG
jgi:hypothetical protein